MEQESARARPLLSGVGSPVVTSKVPPAPPAAVAAASGLAQERAMSPPAASAEVAATRPGSRAARLAHATVTQAVKFAAVEAGVCTRPVWLRRVDEATGQAEVVGLRCGATREAKCAACARRAKRLRERQCAGGWHRADEPLPLPPPAVSKEQADLLRTRGNFAFERERAKEAAQWGQVAELDEAIADVDRLIRASGLRGAVTRPRKDNSDVLAPILAAGGEIGPETMTAAVGEGGAAGERSGGRGGRRVRSTRRRQDAPDLPRRKIEPSTIGRVFEAPDGKIFQPSMFETGTLPSYGRVREDGSPVDPDSYDYQRMARDAIHFPALLDRLVQNVRRADGRNVQYFAVIEPQRRGAPHVHIAFRGHIARALLRQVTTGTYHQVWWPSTDIVVYPEHGPQPGWDDDAKMYRDPVSGKALTTWDEAQDEIAADPDVKPQHVVRFGDQMDIQGVLADSDQARRRIRYLSKYLTKSVAECHPPRTGAAMEHQRRFWEALRFEPCSPNCPNWLRYGIQPKCGKVKYPPGLCRGRVHQIDTLGIGGRRVLVSRQWSGKTLADHAYDGWAAFRQLLATTRGRDDPIDEDTAREIGLAREGGHPHPQAWDRARPGDADVPDLIEWLRVQTTARQRDKAAIAAARVADPPGPEPGTVSSTGGADAAT